MSTPEPPYEPTERLDTLASRPEHSSRPLRRGVLTTGLVVLALGAAGLTGAALARSGGPSPQQAAVAASSSTPTPSGDARKLWRGGARGMDHGMFGLAGALHGELVVPDGSGGYRTVVVQRGKASNVGGSSLTVTSDDGWSRTYDVPASARVGALREGLGSVANGDQIVVVAEQKDGTLTAQHLVDLTGIEKGLGGWMDGPGPMGGMGGWMHGGNDGDGDDGDGTSGGTATQGTGYGA